MASGVTQIDATYLNTLKGKLTGLQHEVEQQLTGLGTAGATSETVSFIEPITSSIKVAAGATSFDAGAALNTALGTMGGSVHDQLTWLNQVLGDMITEITTTVSALHGTESLNNESVDQLITDFQHTISDMNTPAGSGSGTPNTPNTTAT